VSYLVLARKYRPQSFEDLAGQEHVAQTLGNAIDQGRVAHAFLFTGVRGVGKTTSARLLAKCLNCLGADGKATGPVKIPCQVCAACTEITAGLDMDVQEIDGASYNGVDEVRRLQEGLAFRPARDRFKIYIVDEVHMLSSAAWNAFLKTLEEPPPHVKFIFATTEVHKVPVTILSRCQRYDFKLIGADVIRARLAEVLAKEEIQAEDAAIAVLAREAAGSMRDAMSLLDQVIAYSGKTMTAADVARVLGVADRKIMHDLSRAILEGNASQALETVTAVAEQGFDLMHVARDFMRHLRNLVVAKVSTEDDRKITLADLSDAELTDLLALAQTTDLDDLTRVFSGFSKAYDDIARSVAPRAQLEVTLVRLARRPALLSLDELLGRLGDLERRLSGGAPPPPTRGAGGSHGGGGHGGGGRPATSGPSGPSGPIGPTGPTPGFGPPSGGSGVNQPPPGAPQRPRAVAPMETRETRSFDAKASMAVAARLGTALGGGSAARSTAPEFAIPEFAPDTFPAEGNPERTPDMPSVRVGASPSAPPKLPPPLEEPGLTSWGQIVTLVRAEDASIGAMFDQASPIEVAKDRLVIGYRANSFEGARATEGKAVEVLTRIARTFFDAQTQVAVDVSSSMPHASLAQMETERRRLALEEAKAKVRAHPIVAEAMRLFEAELKDVKVPEEP
jgi:DNA polymerase-3 subunit gamma/tau